MQKNTSVTLGKHYEAFVARQIELGRFSSASEAIRAGLRLLEEKDIKIEVLRRALEDGESSGFVNYSLNQLTGSLDKESVG
jgi:antitoxin ParD1/3/4